jgi:hypothetical protein
MSAIVIPLRVDSRIVYGANCSWWDSIDKIGRIVTPRGATLPCCPCCRGMLFEMPSQKEWWEAVALYERRGHPDYRAFIEWLRGQCFIGGIPEALRAYEARLNSTHHPERP